MVKHNKIALLTVLTGALVGINLDVLTITARPLPEFEDSTFGVINEEAVATDETMSREQFKNMMIVGNKFKQSGTDSYFDTLDVNKDGKGQMSEIIKWVSQNIAIAKMLGPSTEHCP